MPGTLVSPQAANSGTAPPRFVARPAERADTTMMTDLIDACRAQQPHHGTPDEDPPLALARLGEADDGHPISWVLFERDTVGDTVHWRLRACFALLIIAAAGEGRPSVWAASIHIDPASPRVLLRGDLTGGAPLPAESAEEDGIPLIAVILTEWLVSYAHASQAIRRVYLTFGAASLTRRPAPVGWVASTVETQVPDEARLGPCFARQSPQRASPELPRAD
ncbi:hypothetical protein [Streptomyces chrestomyceticus]|uniref:hypothetical protein n=1 Tax=Streptomyces chrestomyceticus TaxID=68185 RepID=UPI0019CFAA3F|nr:hypothetical protein [Streptomyces chrestomyceticus]